MRDQYRARACASSFSKSRQPLTRLHTFRPFYPHRLIVNGASQKKITDFFLTLSAIASDRFSTLWETHDKTCVFHIVVNPKPLYINCSIVEKYIFPHEQVIIQISRDRRKFCTFYLLIETDFVHFCLVYLLVKAKVTPNKPKKNVSLLH